MGLNVNNTVTCPSLPRFFGVFLIGMKCGEIVMKFIKSYNFEGVECEKFIFNSSRVGSVRQNHRSHRISYGVIYVQSLRDFLNWELLPK